MTFLNSFATSVSPTDSIYKATKREYATRLLDGGIRLTEQRMYNAPACDARREIGEAPRVFFGGLPPRAVASSRSCGCAEECGYCPRRYMHARDLFLGNEIARKVLSDNNINIVDDCIYDYTEGVALQWSGETLIQHFGGSSHVYCTTTTLEAAQRFCTENPVYDCIVEIHVPQKFFERVLRGITETLVISQPPVLVCRPVVYNKGDRDALFPSDAHSHVFQKPPAYSWQKEYRIALAQGGLGLDTLPKYLEVNIDEGLADLCRVIDCV